jgi:hypothetical protein
VSIKECYFYCALQGKEFDPTPFLAHSEFRISEHYFRGDIGTKGRFKNTPLETGYVCLIAKEGDFDDFIKTLYSVKHLLIENKAETKELHLFLAYTNQCNWQFELNTLTMITNLGLTLTISCDVAQAESSVYLPVVVGR